MDVAPPEEGRSMMKSKWTRGLLSAAAISVLAFGAAACGDGADTDTTTGGETTTTGGETTTTGTESPGTFGTESPS